MWWAIKDIKGLEQWSQHWVCWSSGSIWTTLSDTWYDSSGGPLGTQELDLMILVGPFQLRHFMILLQEGCSVCNHAYKPLLSYHSANAFRQKSHLLYSSMNKFALYHKLLVDCCETMIVVTNTLKSVFYYFHWLNRICVTSRILVVVFVCLFVFHNIWNNPSCLIVLSQ